MHEIKSSVKYSPNNYLSNKKKPFIKIDPVVPEIIACKLLKDPQTTTCVKTVFRPSYQGLIPLFMVCM